MTVATGRQFPNLVLELVHRLLSRPAETPLEVIAEEIEAAGFAGVHDSGFLGMQGQAVGCHPGLHSGHRRLSLLRSQIAKVETRLAEDWPAEAKASLREDLAQLQTQQGIAERRLADYQGQLKTLN